MRILHFYVYTRDTERGRVLLMEANPMSKDQSKNRKSVRQISQWFFLFF